MVSSRPIRFHLMGLVFASVIPVRLFYASAQRVLRAHQGWRTINLFDRSGQHLISLLRPFGTPLPSSEIRAGVRQTLDTGAPAVSDLFVGTVAQVPTVAVTVPVIHAGTLAYVLEAGLDLATL